jgi:uncharacterized membrane protein
MDLSKLSRGDRIVVITGALLVIDLLFLPWISISLPFIGTVSNTGISAPNGFLGFLAALVTAAMVAQILVSKFTSARLPDLPVPWPRAQMLGGVVVLALLVLKLVLHTSLLGFGAYLGILFAAGLAYGGYTVNQESTRAGTTG